MYVHVHLCDVFVKRYKGSITILSYSAKKHPRFANILHSLDVWHKACKLTAKLTEVNVKTIMHNYTVTCTVYEYEYISLYTVY